jgi:hypothetical protein
MEDALFQERAVEQDQTYVGRSKPSLADSREFKEMPLYEHGVAPDADQQSQIIDSFGATDDPS